LESRKYQLKQQIIEAIKASDNDLFSLLKSQWAHRYGVESLEELENLDLTILNQKTTNEDNKKNEQLKNYVSDVDNEVSIKDDNQKETEMINETDKVFKSVELDNKEPFEIKSNVLSDKDNYEVKTINEVRDYKITPKVEALIPLPPKPKYSYLNKWLLRS
tara:strand:- start:109 stop:591 length:483 start_codon:yes stop_codon:yes gene_type:complete